MRKVYIDFCMIIHVGRLFGMVPHKKREEYYLEKEIEEEVEEVLKGKDEDFFDMEQ